MLATIALRRSLSVATSLNAVPPQIVLSASYSVAKGGKPVPKAAPKPTSPPQATGKKPAPPPPSTKKPVAAAKKPVAAARPPTPVKGSKGAEVAKQKEKQQKEREREKAQKDKVKEREKAIAAKDKEKELKEKQRLASKLAKDKEKDKERIEKEREREKRNKAKVQADHDKEKEKVKQQKLKEKEKAEKEKAEQAEKKKEAKERKDAMPTRAKSAYIFFASEARPLVLQDKPDLPITGVMGEIAKRWTALPKEKREKYEKMSEQDKGRFEKDMVVFKKKYPDPPKKPLSAFTLYVKEQSPQFKKANPTAPVTEGMKHLSKQWNALTPDKKKKYEELAAQDKARFVKEKEKFEKQNPSSK